MGKENDPAVSQEKPEINSTVNETASDTKPYFFDAGIKGVFAEKVVREAIEKCVIIPKVFIVKKVKKPFENEKTKEISQKIEVMSGTSIEDAVTFEVTLSNTEVDPIKAINKKYRIIDYTIGLKANMNKSKESKESMFSGYAATGFKLTVTKLEEVKEGGK